MTNELIINEVVLEAAKKKNQIIYGARAYNFQSPDYLKKNTIDYDVLTNKPKRSAKEVAERLSKRISGNIDIVKGSHKGTYRVKVNDKVIVDYTQLKSKPKIKNIFGTQVRDIKSIKRNAQRLVRNPNTEYRREKDNDTLSRIKEIERIERLFKL